MNKSERIGFRQIFKATSIFGGVQVINILITLVRAKAVAYLLGPVGMGLNGLYMTGLNLVKTITSLGLADGAVRELAVAYNQDPESFQKAYTVFKFWIWVTAILGLTSSIIFAPILSEYAFGNKSHVLGFRLLSVTFVFGALSGGIFTVLRATQKTSKLAKGNIFGSISGLLVTLPILYVWGTEGIAPAIVAASVTHFLVSLLFRKYILVKSIDLAFQDRVKLGKPMLKLGFNMSLSSSFGMLSMFILAGFITRIGGLEELGLFNASNAIIGGYVGMIFQTMSTDYFPRLSKETRDQEKWSTVINQQLELLFLFLLLIIPFLIASVNLLIKVLLTDDFLEASTFIMITAVGIPIKGFLWAINYTYLSKDDGRLFLITQLIASFLFLIARIAGYDLYGLNGIAILHVLTMTAILILNLLLVRRRYSYTPARILYKYLTLIIIVAIVLALFRYTNHQFSEIVIWIVVLLCSTLSIYQLNQRLDLIDIVKNRLLR